jgi:hypothetical protein
MLDLLRPSTRGRRGGVRLLEFGLLVAAIVSVVVLVAVAFGSFLHSAAGHRCSAHTVSASAASPSPTSCTSSH